MEIVLLQGLQGQVAHKHHLDGFINFPLLQWKINETLLVKVYLTDLLVDINRMKQQINYLSGLVLQNKLFQFFFLISNKH